MAKIDIGRFKKFAGKSLQTSFGGKVHSKQFKDLLNAKKNPFLASKASKLTTYDQGILKKVAYGKDTHKLNDQELDRALKALKKIGAGSEGVELTHFGKERSIQEAHKFLDKEQALADTPKGPTHQEVKHQQQVHERRMNVERLYRQWAIDKEQGGVAGGRFMPRSSGETTVQQRDVPKGSVTPEPDRAQSSISDHRTASTSASDKGDDDTPIENQHAGMEKTGTEQSGPNPDTSIPSLTGGIPGQDAAPQPDISPLTEGTMRVETPDGQNLAPVIDITERIAEKKSTDDDLPDTSDVDDDLPLAA